MSEILQSDETAPEALNTKQMLEKQWADGKFLCVGLDVVAPGPSTDLLTPAKLIVDATKDVASAFKPNSAFYERYGSGGVAQLASLCDYITENAPDVPIIWDAKRADIANTNNGYRDAADWQGADAMTIHPYLGGVDLKPLLDNPDRAGFVLVHTSNPGAGEFQHLQLKSGEQLWERVAHNVGHSENWQHGALRGIVTGATYPEELAKARHIAGDEVVMLIPGIGTQGGDLEASVRGAMNSEGNGFLINVSSGISKAKDSHGNVTPESIREAALRYHDQIKTVWQDELRNPSLSYEDKAKLELPHRIGELLLACNGLKFGEFTLKNGTQSPVYVDLRETISDPVIRNQISQMYVEMVVDLEDEQGKRFDIISGIPEAATSYAAIVAERLDRRLIQPRVGGAKKYGSGGSIIGRFQKGDSVVAIDDVINDGGAKFETIEQLEAEGLVFGALAVVLDREGGGSAKLAQQDKKMKSKTTLKQMIQALGKDGNISQDRSDEVVAYLDTL